MRKRKKSPRYIGNNIIVLKKIPQGYGKCVGGEDGMQNGPYIIPSPLYLMRTSCVQLAAGFHNILQQRNIEAYKY